MVIKKEYIYIAVALAVAYYLLVIKPKGPKEGNISTERATQLAAGDVATITPVEAQNICRKIGESLEYANMFWSFVAGDSVLYTPLSAAWDLMKGNRANTILIIQGWKYLYGNSEFPNLSDALQSEYLLWGSPTSALRDEVVAHLTQFPV